MYKYHDFGRISVRDDLSDIGKNRSPASTFLDFFKKLYPNAQAKVLRTSDETCKRYSCTQKSSVCIAASIDVFDFSI